MTEQGQLPHGAECLGRGDFVRRVYKLGRARATGVLSVHPPHGRPEVLVLRRGSLLAGGPAASVEARENAAPQRPLATTRRAAVRRLERFASLEGLWIHFEGGVSAYPPGALARELPLDAWARQHLEGQLDQSGARRLLAELAGARLSVRPELVPPPSLCDATDLRILAAMRTPRRLDQIWPLARTPRFRLLTFVHFLRGIGALRALGVAAPRVEPRSEAHRLLGVSSAADHDTLKRAYRRLARALHPDMHPDASDHQRRTLEEQLAQVSRAYRELIGG